MAAESAFSRRENEPGALVFLVLLGGSIIAHGIGVALMPAEAPLRAAARRVEMEFYEPPKPPEPEEPPKPEEPPPPVEVPKVKIKPVVKADAPPPKEEAPPPPNEEAKEISKEPVPIVIGVTMDSTTATGGFAVNVGNTTYGKASDKPSDAAAVKPYAAVKYAPPGSADTEPVLMGEIKIEYPPEAKKNDIEGSVRLRVVTDPEGLVTSVSVISGPGYGLNEAARDALKKFKFRPATKGGVAVGYTFTYTYTFLLD